MKRHDTTTEAGTSGPVTVSINGCHRGFYHLGRSWYKDANAKPGVVDEINIGFYGDGTTGEFVIRWQELFGKIVPRLEAFDDSWAALAAMSDLIAALGKIDDQNASPKEICELLVSLGFNDLTKEKPEGE